MGTAVTIVGSDVGRQHDAQTSLKLSGNCHARQCLLHYPGAVVEDRTVILEQITFPCGLTLSISNFQPAEAVSIVYTELQASTGFGFSMSGSFCCSTPNGLAMNIGKGQRATFSTPALEAYVETPPGTLLQRVSITAFQSDISVLEKNYPELMEYKIFTAPTEYFIVIDDIKVETYAILMQILRCPYAGAARHLFMESKLMELVAQRIYEEESSNNMEYCGMSVRDIEKVHHAAFLLTKNLHTTISMNDISRIVGLSKSKLHPLFRKIYNTTPFDYLRKYRLKKAEELLRDGHMNVTEAALEVGYSSISHFTKAFSEYFHCLPSKCRKH